MLGTRDCLAYPHRGRCRRCRVLTATDDCWPYGTCRDCDRACGPSFLAFFRLVVWLALATLVLTVIASALAQWK
jgi:hypothetical protein